MRKRTKSLCIFMLCVLLGAATCSPVFAKTQAQNPTNESYAWLDDLTVRETSSDYATNTLKPTPLYPYSHTQAEYMQEVQTLYTTFDSENELLLRPYLSLLENVSGYLFSLGLADVSYANRKSYLQSEHGVSIADGANTELFVNALYGTLKHNVLKRVYNITVSIPNGLSLEAAAVRVVAAMTASNGVSAEGIQTIRAYALAVIRKTLSASGVSVSEATDAQLLQAYMCYQAKKAGFGVEYDAEAEEIRLQYLLCVVHKQYAVKLNAQSTKEALELETQSDTVRRLQELILTAMIQSKGGTVAENLGVTALFLIAGPLGCFPLQTDFYSDIYTYTVQLQYKRASIWVTPSSYAQTLGGSASKVSITIDGKAAKDRQANQVALDTAKEVQEVAVVVNYASDAGNQSRTYKLRVVQGTKAAPGGEDPATTTERPPYVIGTDGQTFPNIDGLPDGAHYVTNEQGVIIGVETQPQEEDSSQEDSSESTRADTQPADPQARLVWPYIVGGSLLLLAAAAVGAYFVLTKYKPNSAVTKKLKGWFGKKDDRF